MRQGCSKRDGGHSRSGRHLGRCDYTRPECMLLKIAAGVISSYVQHARSRLDMVRNKRMLSFPNLFLARLFYRKRLIKALGRSGYAWCVSAAVAFEYEYTSLKHLHHLLFHDRVLVRACPDRRRDRPCVPLVHACHLLVHLGLLGPWPAVPLRRRRSRPALGGTLSASYQRFFPRNSRQYILCFRERRSQVAS